MNESVSQHQNGLSKIQMCSSLFSTGLSCMHINLVISELLVEIIRYIPVHVYWNWWLVIRRGLKL